MVTLACSCSSVIAANDFVIEEIVVTAQRIEEVAGKVPMSVSAFTDAMIRDRQIVGFTDLQVTVPNLSFSPEVFGGTRIAIRGIGDTTYDVAGRSYTNPAIPVHVNGTSVPARLNVLEFFDLERLEVMRGPQGTLYGRTATAGAINVVTRKPDFDGHGGYLNLELGDYDHVRVEGAANLALNDRFAFRVAGMALDRDGYTDNLAANDLPDVNKNMDDRELYNLRATAEWRPNDAWTVRAMYSRFREDDSRLRVHNQVCKTSALPVLGCEPDVFALEAPHPGASYDAFIAGQVGVIALGARDAATGLIYEFPRPTLSLREQHTDLNPQFEFDEDAWLIDIHRTFDAVTVELSGSYVQSDYLSRQDFNQDVGYNLNANPRNPSGIWPTSEVPDGVGAWSEGGPCDFMAARAGVLGGCVLNDDLSRSFTYSHLVSEDEFWSVELRLRSDLPGRFNFLLGANHIDHQLEQDYYQAGNTYDVVAVSGLFQPFLVDGPGFQQFYPPFGFLADDRDTVSDSVFGELYFQLNERMKLTLGLRYSHEEQDRERLVMRPNTARSVTGAPDPSWLRSVMLTFFATPTERALYFGDLYGATEAFASATTLAERIAALQLVPVVPSFGESDGLRGTEADWDDVTGRAVLDWTITDDALVYASFTQGFRPGGFLGGPVFDEETVDAYELGAKTRWAEGSLLVNAALFFNDFHDLQLFRAVTGGNAAISNADTEALGFELEMRWQPRALPGLAVDFTYAWLDAELREDEGVDVANRTQGNPDYVLLTDTGRGADFSFQNYVARAEDVLPWIGAATSAGAAFPAPGTQYENGIPSYFSRSFLESVGVTTLAGLPVDISGNEMPNSPPHSIGLGIAHTWPLAAGALTLRYDYYWQDTSYARVFNTPGDKIDSWDQHNASVIFEAANGRWEARAWVRNIADDDIVTGQMIGDDLWGGYRSYFLAEPRIFGASFRYNFGELEQ